MTIGDIADMLDRPTTVAGRDDYDLTAKALKHWDLIYPMLVTMHGRPLAVVQRLNPNFVEQKHGTHRHGAPRLVEFRLTMSWPNEGAWHCLGPGGTSGKDLVALIEYLGETDRQTARNFLSDLVSRIVTVSAA